MKLMPMQTKIALFPDTDESFIPTQEQEVLLFSIQGVCEIGISGASGYYVLIEFDDPPLDSDVRILVNKVNAVLGFD